MKTHKIICILALSFVFSMGYAQKGKVRQASKEYDNLAYLKTSEILLEVAENGYKSVDLLQKLANSFYFNNQMKEAAKWYGELMAMNEDVDSEYYFRYAQSLKSIENYTESDKWMRKFAESDRGDLRGRAFTSTVDYLSMIDEASREFDIVNLNINSEVSDFGTTQYKDQLIFASSRGGGKKYAWNEQPYLDLFSAEKQEDGTYGNVEKLDSDINTKFHESTVAFTPDDNVIYFTRNNYYNKKYKNSEDGTNRLKVFRATLDEDGDWDDVEPVHFNSDEYSVAHPTINVEGTKMYFASDMPGTLGKSDIFEVDINEDGTLGEPVNLGPSVNTEGHETFPFINSEGDLYFSSNGFSGLGGLDVFVIRDFKNKRELNQPMALENVGRPINSPMDDFGYYENIGTKEGFFTSNRDGGKGDDDIYSFIIPDCEQVVEGVVKDQDTQELLPGAKVTLLDADGNPLSQQVVGADASYKFEELECEKEYLIRVELDQFATDEKRFTTPKKKQDLVIEFDLERDEVVLEPCADLAKILDIPIIYFDFDKSNIRRDAEVELQKVLAVLNKYPTMTIDVRSHTDCRGPAAYNEKLSNRRAQSTRQYLIDKGVSAERLTAKGFGESRLVNDCGCEPSNESSCSEEEHQLNRRSEFIVTSINGEKCPEN
ncbi:OmpA family protein [Psychroserpens algicola]|uniref:OmpA family protein n=1 Tax=Psychroserpens algicola TaxID=1719034 RepID=A0ABT0H832_9FLAO|nr:OmpA family protein [Psychroserpens algicola]MCK8480204.1 OmpA family protein [Psychroserpens algicola]